MTSTKSHTAGRSHPHPGPQSAPSNLNVLYLSVTPDILTDDQHFRRTFLKRLGARITGLSYLICAPSGTDRAPVALSDNVTLLPVPSLNRLDYIRRSVRTALALHRRHPFDLVVCMTPIAPAAAAYWFRRRTGVPFVIHWSHDFLGGWGWRCESPMHMAYWPWLRWISRRADGIRPIARPLAESILRGRIPSKRVRLMPTLLHRELFMPADHPDSGPSPYEHRPADEHQLLFVGRLARQKNVGLLIRAVAELVERRRPVHLWIIGDGERRGSLQGLTKRLGLDSVISFIGPLSMPRLQPYYAHCDAFVLPSNHEGLARVLAEAALCAAPIICTGVGGVVDHIRHERTALLVPPRNLQALTKAIVRILDDERLAHDLGEAARSFAEARYPPLERQCDEWVRYWSELASRQPPPGT